MSCDQIFNKRLAHWRINHHRRRELLLFNPASSVTILAIHKHDPPISLIHPARPSLAIDPSKPHWLFKPPSTLFPRPRSAFQLLPLFLPLGSGMQNAQNNHSPSLALHDLDIIARAQLEERGVSMKIDKFAQLFCWFGQRETQRGDGLDAGSGECEEDGSWWWVGNGEITVQEWVG